MQALLEFKLHEGYNLSLIQNIFIIELLVKVYKLKRKNTFSNYYDHLFKYLREATKRQLDINN